MCWPSVRIVVRRCWGRVRARSAGSCQLHRLLLLLPRLLRELLRQPSAGQLLTDSWALPDRNYLARPSPHMICLTTLLLLLREGIERTIISSPEILFARPLSAVVQAKAAAVGGGGGGGEGPISDTRRNPTAPNEPQRGIHLGRWSRGTHPAEPLPLPHALNSLWDLSLSHTHSPRRR